MGAIIDAIKDVQTQTQVMEGMLVEPRTDERIWKAWATEWPEKAANILRAKDELHRKLANLASLNVLPHAPDDPSRPRTQHFITEVLERLDFLDTDDGWDRYIKAGIHAGLAKWISGFITGLMIP